LVDYTTLGFTTFDHYFDTFIDTLLPTNKTYDYFVDWKKVKSAVTKYRNQIFLLNSLREAKDGLKDEFANLIVEYPEVIEVIPLLIAERVNNGKVDVFDPEIEKFIIYDFNKRKMDKKEVDELIRFCEKAGILTLLTEVKDLYDYLLGVEVGLDTNARKNRSGEIFEKLVFASLKKQLPTNVKIAYQDPGFSLYKTLGRSKKEQAKKHDFVIYSNRQPKFVIEANFYNVSGSKPISIAESYVTLQKEAKKYDITFVWITDGPAWHQMKEPLQRAMESIDFVINYRMIPRFCSALFKFK
jgi:type II restriction enzyme